MPGASVHTNLRTDSSARESVAMSSKYEEVCLNRSELHSIQEELETFVREQLPDSAELKRLRRMVTKDDRKESHLKQVLAWAKQELLAHQTMAAEFRVRTMEMAVKEGDEFLKGRAEIVGRQEVLQIAIQQGERDIGKDIIKRLRGTEYKLRADDSDDSDVEELDVRPTHPAMKVKVKADPVAAPTKSKKQTMEVVIERPKKLSKKTRDKSEEHEEDL